MGAAYFYHLTRAPMAETLSILLGKSLGAGWRVEVRGKTEALLQSLDASLWKGDNFMPHGIAGGAHDADQPVLLTLSKGHNNAACLMSVEGADVTPEEIAALDRTCILFDGHDAAALQHAREQWKSLTSAGVAAQYWSEESGKWQKKAESNPANAA